jgi:hypothetical protein
MGYQSRGFCILLRMQLQLVCIAIRKNSRYGRQIISAVMAVCLGPGSGILLSGHGSVVGGLISVSRCTVEICSILNFITFISFESPMPTP